MQPGTAKTGKEMETVRRTLGGLLFVVQLAFWVD